MSTGYYYYRCPCPANDCNGAVCRYPEIMPAPTFTAASCGLYTQDRKLIHFSTTAQDASSTHEQSSFLQGPPAESVLRWDAYKNRQERVQPKEIQPKAPARHGQSPNKTAVFASLLCQLTSSFSAFGSYLLLLRRHAVPYSQPAVLSFLSWPCPAIVLTANQSAPSWFAHA